jgi:hypothetical protein
MKTVLRQVKTQVWDSANLMMSYSVGERPMVIIYGKLSDLVWGQVQVQLKEWLHAHLISPEWRTIK